MKIETRTYPLHHLQGYRVGDLLGLIWVILLISIRSATGECDQRWRMPYGPNIEHVTREGYALHADKLGNIRVDDNISIPLYITWRSDSKTESIHTGYGASIAILDSQFIQISEESFICKQPSGWIRIFWIDKKTGTLISARGMAWRIYRYQQKKRPHSFPMRNIFDLSRWKNSETYLE